jgi:hypothetical protein
MKSITNRIFLFAASALFLGTTAFGQTLKATVPFSFSVPLGGVAAGNYTINLDGNSSKTVRLYNVDTKQAVVAITQRAGGGPADPNYPHLIFRCGEEGCALSEIWTPNGGYAVPQGKIHAHQYLASVPLTVHQGN